MIIFRGESPRRELATVPEGDCEDNITARLRFLLVLLPLPLLFLHLLLLRRRGAALHFHSRSGSSADVPNQNRATRSAPRRRLVFTHSDLCGLSFFNHPPPPHPLAGFTIQQAAGEAKRWTQHRLARDTAACVLVVRLCLLNRQPAEQDGFVLNNRETGGKLLIQQPSCFPYSSAVFGTPQSLLVLFIVRI